MKNLAGPSLQTLPIPELLKGNVAVGALTLSIYRMALLAVSALAALALWLALERTLFGARLRAAVDDPKMARCVGIDVPRVFSLAWVAASMIACVAGIVVGSIGGISSVMGVFGLSVLVVVIVGGLDSVLGALVAGLFVGVVEALAGAFLGGEYKLLATFSLLVLILLIRPYGLFGTHEIERL
jgi:branched-chain amino acid transport system permease protein